ncbi:hypothetical protein RD792_004488 [Penstemon davidsonii]|uniref:LHY n=1 Tax=Penstemon davidsonii TaxID=160366 RepID=A0ABR0DHK2_9LAMI|nr:hypothetical protein RD792_004488 [Penstemon davidsonii]
MFSRSLHLTIPCLFMEFVLRWQTRKPYTITKQRERWTEAEHDKFLEALKLYGRAWQRIEEHIGTKTAVQIRSHAQKFFTKLEKEAVIKGASVGHAIDIEIPPPRPKRKPSSPYPRKTSVGAPTLHMTVKDVKLSNPVSSLCRGKTTLDLDKEPEKPFDDGNLHNTDRYNGKDDCSEVFTLFKTSRKLCTFKEYVSLPKEARNDDETPQSHVTTEAQGLQTDKSGKEPFQDNGSFNTSNVVDSYLKHDKSVHGTIIDELKHSENVETLSTAAVQASQSFPRHVPVHILDGSLGTSAQNISPNMAFTEPIFYQMGEVHRNQSLFLNPAASVTSEHQSNASRSSIHQSFPSYHPMFTPTQNQDDHPSFLHMSSTFSSLIVSSLLQNPAAHAAASFAATLWPCVNTEVPVEPPTGTGGTLQSKKINSTPSMAAIAAATVTAATSWWASHGLLPLCVPVHPGFTCSPESATLIDSNAKNSERRENDPDPALGCQKLEPRCSEALQENLSASKSPTLSLSDSEGSEGGKRNSGVETADIALELVDEAELNDTSKSKSRMQVDRSSCGSNTPSSSEVEADVLEKHTKEKEEKHIKDDIEESKEIDAIHPVSDPFGRRCRSASSINDSWKEVSEEGRLAFQALFTREVLPQSFSPPHDLLKMGIINIGKDKFSAGKKDDGLGLDLNASLTVKNKEEEGLLNYIGLGNAAKLKARRSTGFKPYKRCSVDAKESKVSANCDEEKGPKRLRLEGQAST